MNLRNLTRGLYIIGKYLEDDDPGCISAEHDQIWVGPCVDDTEWTFEDMDELRRLGFFEDEDSWSAFV